jgi:hypothetical protein
MQNVQSFKNCESMAQVHVHVHAHGRCPKCQAFKLSRTDMEGESLEVVWRWSLGALSPSDRQVTAEDGRAWRARH